MTENYLWDFLITLAQQEDYSPPINEIEFLKEFFPYYREVMHHEESLYMFKMHFLLYHYLHKLRFRAEKHSYLLYMHYSKVYFMKKPKEQYCPHFDENLLSFCMTPKPPDQPFCEKHRSEAEEMINKGKIINSALHSYYLDLENLHRMTQEELEYMMSTWEALIANPQEIMHSYQVLGLTPGENWEKIVEAYRKQVKKYHPDIAELAVEDNKIVEINTAYHTLKKYIQKKNSI